MRNEPWSLYISGTVINVAPVCLLQLDQPAEWLFNTLKLAANPSACVSYQIWLHTQAPGTNTPTGTPTAGNAKSTSCYGKPPAVHASLCIASGPAACHFMWFTAPLSHAEDVPGVHKIILGGGSSFSTQVGSPDQASHKMVSGTGTIGLLASCCSSRPLERKAVLAGQLTAQFCFAHTMPWCR